MWFRGVGERQTVCRTLSDLSVSVNSIRSPRNLIRRTLIVNVIKLVDWLVVSVLEYCSFRVMGIVVDVMELGRSLWLYKLVHVLHDRIQVLFLERTCTLPGMVAAACPIF